MSQLLGWKGWARALCAGVCSWWHSLNCRAGHKLKGVESGVDTLVVPGALLLVLQTCPGVSGLTRSSIPANGPGAPWLSRWLIYTPHVVSLMTRLATSCVGPRATWKCGTLCLPGGKHFFLSIVTLFLLIWEGVFVLFFKWFYLFMAALGLRCYMGFSLAEVLEFLTAVASLVAEHGP